MAVVVKFGGELLEDPSRLRTVVAAIASVAGSEVGSNAGHSAGHSVGHSTERGAEAIVIVHGGGKEIDAALATAGLEKRQIDGLRITDQATLEVVVSVLAGTVNTRFVAALTTAGVRAVGLTGADAACGLCNVAPPHRTVDGRTVDLGRVGIPADRSDGRSVGGSDDRSDMRLLTTLTGGGFVPVVACIGLGGDGRLLNVNADTLAGHLAARLAARRLVIAGTTAGVLNEGGATIAQLEPLEIERLIHSGTATAGMIAKLRACAHALTNGVDDVVIVDGRDQAALEAAARGEAPEHATQIVASAVRQA